MEQKWITSDGLQQATGHVVEFFGDKTSKRYLYVPASDSIVGEHVISCPFCEVLRAAIEAGAVEKLACYQKKSLFSGVRQINTQKCPINKAVKSKLATFNIPAKIDDEALHLRLPNGMEYPTKGENPNFTENYFERRAEIAIQEIKSKCFGN